MAEIPLCAGIYAEKAASIPLVIVAVSIILFIAAIIDPSEIGTEIKSMLLNMESKGFFSLITVEESIFARMDFFLLK